MRKPTKHIFNVILTFDHEDQEIFNFVIASGFTELDFVVEIIKRARHPSSLIKISTCLIGMCDIDGGHLRSVGSEDLPQFLHETRGKYYFTDQDEWTLGWMHIRNQVVEAMINSQSARSSG